MKLRNRRKYRHETAVAINMTVPPVLHTELEKLIARFGFGGPSDYFQNRIRLDAGLTLKTDEQTTG